jgi:glutamyl-tRNA reductase
LILLIYGINSKIIDKEKIIEIVSGFENLFNKFINVFGTIKKDFPLAEAVIISTCLRYEILISIRGVEAGKKNEAEEFIITRLEEFFNGILNERGLKISADKYFRAVSSEALGHLYSVMSGFESEDIGEIQVLGQIKDGYSRCREAGISGKIIDKIYEAGLKCVIKVRNKVPAFTDRNIIKKNIMKKIHERFGDGELCRIKALIAGSGGCARSIASALKVPGIKTDLIKKSGDIKYEELINYDILIFDFANVGFRVKTDFLCGPGARKIVVIDMSISRNVPPEAASIENIELISIEELIPSNWKEGEIIKKRGLKGDFYRQAGRIVAAATKSAFEELIFHFENESRLALIKEIAAAVEAEFDKSSQNMNAGNYIEKNDKLKRALLKKIPALIKRKSPQI